jgi:ribosomal protein L16/L10AE
MGNHQADAVAANMNANEGIRAAQELLARARRCTKYKMDSNGTIRRVFPQRPWRGKLERRRVLRARRQQREEAA